MIRASLTGALLALGVSVAWAQTPAPAAPLRFATPKEESYWTALVACRKDIEATAARKDGAVRKVETASTTINLSCPVPVACPSLTCPALPDPTRYQCWPELGLALAGGAAAAICAASCGGDGVTVVR